MFSTTPQCADWSQVLSKDFSSWSSVCRQNKTKTKPGHYLTKWTSYWKKLTIDAKNTTVHQTNSKTSFYCRSLDVQRAKSKQLAKNIATKCFWCQITIKVQHAVQLCDNKNFAIQQFIKYLQSMYFSITSKFLLVCNKSLQIRQASNGN